MAFLSALLHPAERLHETWLQMRSDNLYKLNHTSQVISLRQALNDALDPVLRRIYLIGSEHERNYLYLPAEKLPKYLGKIYIYRQSEYSYAGADFFVFVPKAVFENRWFELKAILDFYKMAPKRYKITCHE
ncbi:MAG: hypothetical protein V6Z82_04710 [Flavobacteriales bacterium]